MILHYILNQEEDSLMLRFFNAQLSNPVEENWTEQVQKDLQDLNMNHSTNEINLCQKNALEQKLKMPYSKQLLSGSQVRN